MTYDEISLVDKGANQHAHVVIVKRDVSKKEAKAPVGNMPKNRKADYYNSKKAKNPSARSSSWDEKKHPRKPAGSPAGGEFDKTSAESKRKYGKDGTTKAKQDAKKKGGEAKHTTKKGDTLWDLAVKHYGDGTQWKKIARANGVKDPRKLPVGKELKIPGSKLAKDTKKKTSTAKPKYRKVMEPGGRVHDERVPVPKKKKSPPTKKKTTNRRRKRKTSEVKKFALHNMYINYLDRG
ncbi:LysM peptidoglycan-binding domain-containing protein [Streptomyces levis]